jgi:hypothetical protein
MSARQFSNGPPMVGVPGNYLAPMMVPQQSAGYMGQPMNMPFSPQQMGMYASGSPQMYGSPSQPPSNYSSPGRGAPMMVQQGSHQGHPQPVYVSQAQYGGGPYGQQHPNSKYINLQSAPGLPDVFAVRGGYPSPQPQQHYPGSPYQGHHFQPQPMRTPSHGYIPPMQHPPHQNIPTPSQHGSSPSGVPDVGAEEPKQ